jgi:hypothetical protein
MTTISHISVKQGDTYISPLTITDDDGAIINLTGATLTFHVRAYGATTDAITPAPTLALTAPTQGIATLTLTAAQTATLAAARTYRYEVEVVDSLSNITTPVQGLCYAQEDLG